MKNLPDIQDSQAPFWEEAGEASYHNAMFASAEVADHVMQRMWNICTDMAFEIGIKPGDKIFDLGCGDGSFANRHLSKFFSTLDACDFSAAGVERANRQRTHAGFNFFTADITTLDYATLGAHDGAFMIGILHHVKKSAPQIVKAMRSVAPRIVVLEPNGSHPVRKLLELTPQYRRAGEKSFTATAVVRMFNEAGYELRSFKRAGLLPNVTPKWLAPILKSCEAGVESSRLLSLSCTTSMFGFVRR